MITIGVDAGGTSTVAALARDGAFVREATGPAANATSMDVAQAADAILQTIRNVADGAAPESIYIGAAGAGRERIAAELQAHVQRAYPKARVVVDDDTVIALRGAIAQGPGVVLIAGTGSVAYAENGDTIVRTGGAGYLLGDEGSAFAMGLAAAKLYARALDGRAPRDETIELVARTLDAPDRTTLLDAMYGNTFSPAAIAAMAPEIITFAGLGNRSSTKIVQDAAKELGDLLKSAVKLANLLDASPHVALAGGLMRENSLLTFLLETRINGDIPGATIVRNGDEPVRGALRLAQAHAVHA
jgi:N-acetylglucosamine kinase-like BadF-type ATPase